MRREGRILLTSNVLWNLGEGMLGPLFAVFAERVGGDVLDISWAWATYLFVTGLCVVFVGRISDRMDKVRLMVAGYWLNVIFTFSYLFVSSPAHLLIVQAGLGVALALANPTWYALYDKYSGGRRDGYVWGLADGQTRMMAGVAVLIGGFIVSHTSFTVLFLLMGSVQLVATLYQMRLLR